MDHLQVSGVRQQTSFFEQVQENRVTAYVTNEAARVSQQATTRVFQTSLVPLAEKRLVLGFEEAKIAVTKHALNVLFVIKEYNLTQEQKFEIAKIAATQGESNAPFLRVFEGETFTREQRFEIIKLLAPKNIQVVCHKIDKYDLTQEQRFEVAKIIATQKVEKFIWFIKKYDLTENQWIEVANVIGAQYNTNVFWPFLS